MHFGAWEQCFTLGKEDDAERVCEDYETTIFGPVIPEGYGSYGGATPLVEKGEKLALLWTAAEFPEDNSRMVTSFWRLAKSKNVTEATDALQDFSSPSMAVVMAFTDGTIAFRLSGIVPLRGDDQRVDFPRRGASRSSGWVGRMPAAQKPQSTNPEKGFIVAANQRVVDNDVLTQRSLGFEEAKPYRAMRITERLTKMLDDKKPTIDELCSIQQDTVSIEAKKLAPVLAKHCPDHVDGHDDARVQAFCKAIDEFDGDFTLDAVALPYARTAREFILSVFEAHVDNELALDMASTTSIVVAFTDLAVAESKGDVKAAIFDDPRKAGREGLDPFVARAVKRALDKVVADAGGGEGDWTWGKNHQMSTRGLLYSAPVVGFLFDTWGHDESGISEAPRAEGPDFANKMRVRFGAGLRLFAEMKEKGAEVRMVNDSGQSGHFGHAHLADQNPLWSAGTPYKIAKTKKEIDAELEGSLDLLPKK
jgi:penicillin amidase